MFGPPPDEDVLRGAVVVVTGASRGLGAGLAGHFADRGLRLGLCARTIPAVPPGHDDDTVVASVDVTDAGALEAFAAGVVERFGRIDLWVNNAGILEPVGPLAEAEPAAVERHIAVNVVGTLLGSAVFARHVRSRPGGGTLVNISSGAATNPRFGWVPYGAAKAAVDQASRALALEEAAAGLRVHALAPGLVDTGMQALLRSLPPERFPEADRFRQVAAEGGFTPPGRVAEAILELAFAPPAGLPVVLRVPG